MMLLSLMVIIVYLAKYTRLMTASSKNGRLKKWLWKPQKRSYHHLDTRIFWPCLYVMWMNFTLKVGAGHRRTDSVIYTPIQHHLTLQKCPGWPHSKWLKRIEDKEHSTEDKNLLDLRCRSKNLSKYCERKNIVQLPETLCVCVLMWTLQKRQKSIKTQLYRKKDDYRMYLLLPIIIYFCFLFNLSTKCLTSCLQLYKEML